MFETVIPETVLPYLKPYLDLLSPVHQGKPRFMALCNTVLIQAAHLLRLYAELLPEAFDPDKAKGVQLNTLGQLVGVSRPKLTTSDADFRAYLRAWIQLHHWDGTNGTLPETLSAAFPGQDARLIDNGDGTVTASIIGSLPFSLRDVFPCPAGVRLIEAGE